MKTLTIIEVVLTTLLLAVFSAKVTTIKMHVSDGVLGSVLNVACYAVLFSWVLFTVIYGIVLFTRLGAWFFRRLADDKTKDLN